MKPRKSRNYFAAGDGTNDAQLRGNNGMNMEQITALTDKVMDDAEKEHDALADAVHSSFTPVTHVIKSRPINYLPISSLNGNLPYIIARLRTN
jgi:hypothetical protein